MKTFSILFKRSISQELRFRFLRNECVHLAAIPLSHNPWCKWRLQLRRNIPYCLQNDKMLYFLTPLSPLCSSTLFYRTTTHALWNYLAPSVGETVRPRRKLILLPPTTQFLIVSSYRQELKLDQAAPQWKLLSLRRGTTGPQRVAV